MSAPPTVLVLTINPFDHTTSLLIPAVTQRILQFANENYNECDPRVFTSLIMARLWALDPRVQVAVLFEPATQKVVGHAVASIETEGARKWVFISQAKADGNVGDAIKRAIELADAWGKEHGAEFMVMATTRSDTAWKKRYGFTTMRHMMIRRLGAVAEESDE